MHAGVQGRAESKCDRNLVTSNSDIISVEAPAKRKADAEFADDQLPVKKMKSGKHCYCVTYADRLRVGRWLVVTCVHCGQTVHPRPIVTMEH